MTQKEHEGQESLDFKEKDATAIFLCHPYIDRRSSTDAEEQSPCQTSK